MFRKAYFWVLVVSMQMVFTSVSYATSDSANFSKYYKSGDYDQALKYALILSTKNPRNLTIRYYYADCLSKVGLEDQAVKQFQVIIKYSTDKNLVRLAKQSLSGSGHRRRRESRLDAATREKEKVMKVFDSKISDIQNSSLSQDEKDRQLERVYDELQRQKNAITRRYYNMGSSRSASSNKPLSSVRVVPGMSGQNVKNYENLGDSSDVEYIPDKPPLRAKAKKLKVKPRKKDSATK